MRTIHDKIGTGLGWTSVLAIGIGLVLLFSLIPFPTNVIILRNYPLMCSDKKDGN